MDRIRSSSVIGDYGAIMIAVARHMEQVPISRAYYDKKRAQDKAHNQAVRALWRTVSRAKASRSDCLVIVLPHLTPLPGIVHLQGWRGNPAQADWKLRFKIVTAFSAFIA
jgi:hypothetical protein